MRQLYVHKSVIQGLNAKPELEDNNRRLIFVQNRVLQEIGMKITWHKVCRFMSHISNAGTF